jgi:4-amino-4-deoxy-L-arabinose transferase-like glycosyltransferase
MVIMSDFNDAPVVLSNCVSRPACKLMTTHTFYSTPAPARHAWLFWLGFALLWFCSLGHNTLIHPDEGRYASISLGMLQTGDWITPRLNGLLYFEKPPLQYWIGALCFKLFGINEFAARFWPALSGFLSVAAVGFSAKKLWGDEAGHLAAMVMGSCCWVVANSHFLNLDTGLNFFLTLTLCAFLLAQREDAGNGERRSWMWLCWAAMAGATLSKGLIGLMIPGAVLVLYSLVYRQFSYWRRLHLITGLVLFLLLAAPWFILVSERNPGFADFFFIHEHFQRFLTTEARRTGPLWYFVPFLLVGFLPWTTLLPSLLMFGHEREGRGLVQCNRLLLVWVVFVFAFFSKSGSKLPSYILPMFPALALLAGHYLSHTRAQALGKHLLLPALVWLGLLFAYPFSTHFSGPDVPLAVIHHFAGYIALAAMIFLLGAACCWRFLVLDRKLGAVLLLSLASVAALMLVAAGYDNYGELKSSRALVASLRPSRDTEVFAVRFYDQTLPFYLQRNVTLVDYIDEFELGERAEPTRWIPTLDGFISRWQAAPRALAMMAPDTYEQLNQRGVAMRVVFRDARRLVVSKP